MTLAQAHAVLAMDEHDIASAYEPAWDSLVAEATRVSARVTAMINDAGERALARAQASVDRIVPEKSAGPGPVGVIVEDMEDGS